MRDGWRTTELGELVSIASGGTPSKENQALWGGEIPWVTAKDLKRKYLTDSIDRLTGRGALHAKLAPAGALLILVRGMTLFRDVPLGIAVRPVAFNQDIKALVPDRQVDPEYLFYSLICSKELLRRLVDTAGHGTGRLDTSALLSHPVDYPTEHRQQRRIAEILRSWDEAIETAERLIAAKERRLNWFIAKVFHPQAEWKVRKFGEFLSESRVQGSDGSKARKLTVRLYGKGVIAKEERNGGSAQTGYFRRNAGQLIYGKLDFLNGAFGIVPAELDGFESTLDLPAFDIADDVNSQWLLEFLIRPAYYTRQVGLARGQRKARRVSPADLLDSEIKVPPRATQNRVAEQIIRARHEVRLTRELLEMTNRQKRGLMQKLLTGEWRVPLRDSEVDDLAERAATGEAA